MSANREIEDLKSLLDKMVKCDCCSAFCSTLETDKEKIIFDTVNPNAEVLIMSEALAPEQVITSGVNFFKKDGAIGDTGKYLEPFLNKFNQTIFPPKTVVLKSGDEIHKKENRYNTIYNTEIIHCFPGHKYKKNGAKEIRHPDNDPKIMKCLVKCLAKGFVLKEIEIIDPIVILLMGRWSYKSFYKHILEKDPKPELTEKIDNIAKTGEYEVYQNKYPLIPIQHASGANPNFKPMTKNKNLINLIKNLLE